jgi:hypothetical protein
VVQEAEAAAALQELVQQELQTQAVAVVERMAE